MRWLRRLVRDLSGRSSRAFVELLARQVDATLEGGRLVRSSVRGDIGRAEVRARVREVEHDGDEARAVLIAELSSALTTPIDREDLFRVSRSIDDVLDNLRDFAREMDLYRVAHREDFGPLVDAVITAIEALRAAVCELTEPARVSHSSLAAKKASGEIRRLYQQELARLFKGDVDMEVLKHRELLRRLDIVGLRLGEAADALADGTMKRSL